MTRHVEVIAPSGIEADWVRETSVFMFPRLDLGVRQEDVATDPEQSSGTYLVI